MGWVSCEHTGAERGRTQPPDTMMCKDGVQMQTGLGVGSEGFSGEALLTL